MKAILLAAGVMMVAGQAGAGPDETSNRFMNDSVSMLDWGLERTESYLRGRNFPHVTASYDWDANRIRITESQFDAVIEPSPESDCKEWIKNIKFAAMINHETGKPWGASEYSLFASLFSHNGFTRSLGEKKDVELLPELDKIILVTKRYWARNDDGTFSEQFSCESALASPSISITDNRPPPSQNAPSN